ncbi:MAG: PHP domain-containing protein [Treponema sp.]|jgi:predicted metal-dependent phosphoesterase TrpH|nr:PHP domain-containing protein [Treponema sp.]
MIDLHTHSTASDGEFPPERLVQEAARAGISAIALTDHDTIAGLEIARKEAETRGIRLIPGVELEISWLPPPGVSGTGPGGEFHLLGLGISRPSPAFRDALAELSRLREARNREMLGRMNKLGMDVSYDELKALSGGHSIGRPHFAGLLVNRKIVKTREQAFERYLVPGKPLYVPKGGLNFDRAAVVIREAGGIPVLAHPMSLFVAWGRLPDLIRELRDRGLAGLEAWHPSAKVRSCRRLEDLARSLGLYVTEGSDFHGPLFRPGRQLGYSAAGRKIGEAVLEAIGPLLADTPLPAAHSALKIS